MAVDVGLTPATLPLALDPTLPRVPLPGKWTFWAETMVGAQRLGMVDVSSFYCVRRLNAFGHGNFRQPAVRARLRDDADALGLAALGVLPGFAVLVRGADRRR
jgi:hypothetical protein